eukprot:SM000100S09448  [mRNA]  locus=s100:405144:410147:+ [translate_table: standard]
MVEATELLWRAYHVLEMELAAVNQALLCLAVALPFCFYWYLWTHPRRWVAWCRGADPCRTMARTAHLLKLVQAAAVLSQSTLRWPPWYCVLAIVAGQALNIRVYQLLGESGVYYGVRFGKYVPWVVDFPFTYIQDPQYIGSILTLLGCLCWAPWPLIAVWAAGYFFMIVLERHEDVKTRAKPQPQPPQEREAKPRQYTVSVPQAVIACYRMRLSLSLQRSQALAIHQRAGRALAQANGFRGGGLAPQLSFRRLRRERAPPAAIVAAGGPALCRQARVAPSAVAHGPLPPADHPRACDGRCGGNGKKCLPVEGVLGRGAYAFEYTEKADDKTFDNVSARATEEMNSNHAERTSGAIGRRPRAGGVLSDDRPTSPNAAPFEMEDARAFSTIVDEDGYLSIAGFGSLLSERSAKYTFPELKNFRTARVRGFRRVFAHVAPVFLQRGIANMDTREMSSLSAEADNSNIVVTVFEIKASEVPAFIEREHEFRYLAVVPESLDGQALGRRAVLCSRYSNEEYRSVRCQGSEDEYHRRYGRYGINKIWIDDILPCRVYLRHCVLAAETLGKEACDSFLDATFLADRTTTIRQYLDSNPSIMTELPPPALQERYGG